MNAVVSTQQSNNPFAAQVATRQSSNAVADAGQQREIAEVQAAMAIAKRFPRDPVEAMDRILQACTRPTLAEGALYSYSRGGSEITGPSIRLAEAIAQAWGNTQFGIRELEQRNGESTVEAYAWDLESNTRQSKVFQVPHIRYTRNGSKKLADPRDVYELVANQGARRLRACILGVVPGDVVEAAVHQCETTLKTSADTSPEAIKKMVKAFGDYGVTVDMIQKRIQCRLEAIRPAQVVQMKKIYASLRDGMSSPADWFDLDAASTSTTDKITGAAKSAPVTKKAEPAKKAAPEREEAPAADLLSDAEDLYDVLLGDVKAAKDVDTLDLIADQIREIKNKSQREALSELYQQRRDELAK